MRNAIGRYKFEEKQRSEMAEHGILPKSHGTGFPIESGHKFTVVEYMKLAEAGIPAREDKVELVDGVIFKMAPIGRPHGHRTNRVARVFIEKVPDNIEVNIQSTICLGDRTAPEPDIALLRNRSVPPTHPRRLRRCAGIPPGRHPDRQALPDVRLTVDELLS